MLFRLSTERVNWQGLLEAAVQRGVPLKVIDMPSAEIAALYERRLVRARPDGHVAWWGKSLPEDIVDMLDTVRGAKSNGVAARD